MKEKTILAIGAHIGDAELTAGALLAQCAVHGGKAVTLALTAGEKGAPVGADIEEYRRSKIREAEAFAAELGAGPLSWITPTDCCRTMTKSGSGCAT